MKPNTMHHNVDDPVCWSCENKAQQAHPYLIGWFHDIKKKYPTIHIAWSYRGVEDQERLFLEKETLAHYPNSKHNYAINGKPCSLALDLFLIDADGVGRFPWPFYKKLADENLAERLPIEWGGNFVDIKDGDHFEVSKDVQPL
jgi:hypothetical protein